MAKPDDFLQFGEAHLDPVVATAQIRICQDGSRVTLLHMVPQGPFHPQDLPTHYDSLFILSETKGMPGPR